MSKGWTLRDMPRQDGRRAIITGGNSGIGYFTALELVRHGATVVLAARSRPRAEEAALRLGKEVPGAQIEVALLDLASLASVRAFAEAELGQAAPLDLLINNAGVYCPPQRLLTAEGYELQFGTNVLGHFALAGLLLPKLERRAEEVAATGGLVAGEHEPPRIVTIASIAHRHGQIHFDDLQWEGSYQPSRAYAQSKLANLVLALELDRRLRARQLSVLSVAAHPGLSDTNLFKGGNYSAFERRMRHAGGWVIAHLFNTGEQGALPTLFAATAPLATGGGYYGPQSFFESRGGDVGPAKIEPRALDPASASRLWSVCETLTGVHYLD